MAFYNAIPASDGTSLNAPSNAEFKVFEVSDTARAYPLELRTVAGTNAAPLVTTAQGVVPPVEVVSPNFEHIFKSGEWEWKRESSEGLKLAVSASARDALEASVAAQGAQAAAEEAARNSSAPTQEAVVQALATEGPARTAVDEAARAVAQDVTADALSPILEQMEEVPSQIAAGVAPVKQTISSAADPFAYIDSMKLLCEFPVRENGESFWPQGFSLDVANDKIYVANYDTAATVLRMDIRRLSTGRRLESKTFAGFPANSWSEGCPWFLNERGELCFVVFTKLPDYPTSICILNYSTGTVGAGIPLPEVQTGTSKADVEDGYFIVADAGANSVAGFVTYTWESVKAGSPVFVSRTVAGQMNGGTTFFKNQALGVVGGNFFLVQGAQAEYPAITSYDKHGAFKEVHAYPKPNFGRMVNKLAPEKLQVPEASFFFEAEGATNLNGRLVSGFIVGNNTFTGDSRYLILEHGRVDGELAKSAPVINYGHDSGWVTLTPEPGWSANPPAQIRRKGNEVFLRGELFNATQEAGNYTTALTIPPGFRPPINTRIPQTYSAVPMAIRIDASGPLRCWTDIKTGSPRPLAGVHYFID